MGAVGVSAGLFGFVAFAADAFAVNSGLLGKVECIGREAKFMVDTGASVVSVSEEFAQQAGLTGGTPTTFHTANGPLNGRLVQGVTVALGPVSVSNVRVGVGLVGGDNSDALLGQSFLSKFEITINEKKMVLRGRGGVGAGG